MSNNGAVHTLIESVYLGASAPDGETDGQPQATALGDDNNGYDGKVEDYYFETPIFIDGFESSDTSAWSNTVGGPP